MLYTTKDAVEKYLLTEIDDAYNDQLDSWIDAVSQYMDTHTGRKLVAETAPETRKYDGNGTEELLIDDAHTITAVTIDGVAVTPYQYPANKPRKNRLVSEDPLWITGRQNVEVTGKFGYYASLADAPAIQFAATVLVAGIVNQSKNQDDGVQSEKIGQFTVVYKDSEQRAQYKAALKTLDAHRTLSF
jgi:hypothetical protein